MVKRLSIGERETSRKHYSAAFGRREALQIANRSTPVH